MVRELQSLVFGVLHISCRLARTTLTEQKAGKMNESKTYFADLLLRLRTINFAAQVTKEN